MPTSSAEFRLSPAAKEDMEAVWLHSLQEWGSVQADRYIDDLIAAFHFLASTPKAGASCETIRIGYRKYSVVRHVVFYRDTDYGIEVIRVLHARMLASRHF